MDFKELLEEHQHRVRGELNNVILDFVKRSQEHDMDKLLDERVANVYEEHFTTLKTIEFGTEEYYNYERKNFASAHEIHAQNRHHFYSFRNTTTKPNLSDLIEAMIDIRSSMEQYNGNFTDEEVLEVLKKKGILDVSLEEYILNSLKEMGK